MPDFSILYHSAAGFGGHLATDHMALLDISDLLGLDKLKFKKSVIHV